jgi:AcrR family transcriptional regulator
MGRPPLRANQQDAVLDTAASLFANKGYDAGSIGEIATALGISKAAIYHYFSSKQEIFDAIILRALQQLRKSTSAAVARQHEPAEQLRAFMQAHAHCFETHHHDFVAMFVAFGNMKEQNQRQEAVRLRTEHESMLRAILKAGVDQGTFSDIDLGTASRAVLSMLNWMARWFHPGGPLSAEQIAEGYFELMVAGMAGAKKPSTALAKKRAGPTGISKAAAKTFSHVATSTVATTVPKTR